ncbi:L,D-transpeptidase family protein [uncultured Pseudoalteromonas sp.]|uniref:L,D-transpeptidase family protein n=1 Tax=uncultured Pseudoalteromonas sp. TaxID=114053 RepID=UPI0025D56A9C|nr:L,D-transpeptidase family protein [uncultured Pseudoalteromonas sp.]|tara:strand:+ start:8040 stop:9659 length:1620 start_codon:yes stop_codon:yes gene_type:complete
MKFFRQTALVSCFLLGAPVLAENQYLQQQLEPILIGESHTIEEQQIHSPEMTIATYKANGFEQVWADIKYAKQVLNLIAQSELEGLSPNDYHFDTLLALIDEVDKRGTDAAEAQFDVLMTDAIMTYAKHLIRGKVNPKQLASTWNYEQFDVSPDAAAASLLKHVKSKSLDKGLNNLKPVLPHYQRLKKGLVFYRELDAKGELPAISLQSKALKPGQTDPAVPLLKQKLHRLNYYTGNLSDASEYDDELVDAVKKFQYAHQVDDDGIIGGATLKLLNKDYSEYVNDILVNLERIRWVDNTLTERFLIVNIAGYKLYLFEDNKLKWQTNVVVGRNYTKTPIFKGQMSYIVMNPTWTVPRSISGGIIKKMKENPNYLNEKDFVVVDSRRNPVDSESIDWANASRKNFPYWFVQQPSENNSLGQIKFMFPNKYSIYLHDTPAKSLFQQDQRAFSHGCVRVDDPFTLAEKILGTSDNWSRSDIDDTIAAKETKKVSLSKPLDVLLMYWTVSGNDQEGLHFYSDVYNRDAELLKKLTTPLTNNSI